MLALALALAQALVGAPVGYPIILSAIRPKAGLDLEGKNFLRRHTICHQLLTCSVFSRGLTNASCSRSDHANAGVQHSVMPHAALVVFSLLVSCPVDHQDELNLLLIAARHVALRFSCVHARPVTAQRPGYALTPSSQQIITPLRQWPR